MRPFSSATVQLLADQLGRDCSRVTWPSAAARTIIVIVWLPELPPMPATIGISAASATSSLDRAFEDADHARRDERGDEVDREPRPAVLERFPHRREDVFLLAQARLRQHFLFAALADEVEHFVDRHAADQLAVRVDDRRGHEVVALERARRGLDVLVLQQLDDRRLHHVGHERVGFADDQPVERQHAEQALVAVDDEELVGLRRQLVEAAQVAQHHFERHVRAHLHVVEVHQRADHVLLERHRRAQLLALLDGKALEHIVHHLLRQVVGDRRDLVGGKRLGRGDELVGVHRRDERLADGVGDLDAGSRRRAPP